LEGHELSDMFVASMTARNPIANHIQKRIDEGTFRKMDPQLAARGFFGMFASFVLWQEIFGLKKTQPFDRDQVVRTFVSIFLKGITKE
jgi:TetR/AcrR family transcriptional regulator